MFEPEILSLEIVQLFMISQGGKVANHELVKHFKSYLNTANKDAARLVFKDIVNELATVSKEGNEKFLVLKPKYMQEKDPVYSVKDPPSSVNEKNKSVPNQLSNSTSVPNFSTQTYDETPFREDVEVRRSQIEFQPQYSDKMVWEQRNTPRLEPPLSHCQSSPNLIAPNEDEVDSKENNGLFPPQPPPRRKLASTRSRENRGTKIEEKLRQLNEEIDCVTSSPPKTVRDEEILGMSLSPGIVKERAKKINKMASEVDVSTKTPSISSSLSRSSSSVFSSSNQLNSLTRLSRQSKHQDDDDSTSVTALDPNSKQWVLQAAKGDYYSLVKLLQEEPKLAGFKDFVSGYTALHWAAKHGKDEIIKLIAGTYKIKPNVKSHGGYTPLHLAAMFGQEHIMELLVNTYGADPTIRDYSGKRPDQYLPSTPYARNFSKLASGTEECGSRASGSISQQGAFERIGSLNSKVRKTAASVLGSYSSNGPSSSKKSLTRIKSWGSADSLSSEYQCSSMPPPIFKPKKKKTKKSSADSVTSMSSICSDNVFRAKSENSDSDSGLSSFV